MNAAEDATGTGERGGGRGRSTLRGTLSLALSAGLILAMAVTASPAPSPDDDYGDGTGDQDATTLTAPQAAEGPCDDGYRPEQSRPAARVPGRAVQEIRERGSLTVGVDQNSYLWGYREPGTGDIVGFDIDLVEAIARDVLDDPTPDIIYRAIPTDQREEAVMSGQVDMVVRTMSITCRRLENVAFSTAYFETGQQLLVPRGSEITGFDDSLTGRRVCSAAGSTAEALLRDEPHGAHLETEANHLDCLVQLQLGLADALVTDAALAAGHIAQDPSMRLVGRPLRGEFYGVAMSQESPDLVSWVNAVLEDFRTDGSWRTAYQEWLAAYLGGASPAPPEPRYRD
ncbi:glutamate ABC transporter substrate-binding protein [Streptomyces sp. NPDC049879]|uniref:glutamate ABC transporter substrate-binding protein n=1 Tax=Streptomyces sp. NPDC049879 TaxID=3365598 RepID=UPI0037AD408D